jgi:hypothetical protein
MTRKREQPSTDASTALREILERDKRAASADFDDAAFAARLRRRLAEDRSSRRKLPARWLSTLMRPAVLVAAAALVIALVVWTGPFRVPRTDPELIARVLSRAEFFSRAPLDRASAGVAGKLPQAPERDLAWSIEALLYRAQRGSDDAPGEGDVARAILAALAGAPPAAPVSWPRVDPDALARRISVMSRSGALLRAFGAVQ